MLPILGRDVEPNSNSALGAASAASAAQQRGARASSRDDRSIGSGGTTDSLAEHHRGDDVDGGRLCGSAATPDSQDLTPRSCFIVGNADQDTSAEARNIRTDVEDADAAPGTRKASSGANRGPHKPFRPHPRRRIKIKAGRSFGAVQTVGQARVVRGRDRALHSKRYQSGRGLSSCHRHLAGDISEKAPLATKSGVSEAHIEACPAEGSEHKRALEKTQAQARMLKVEIARKDIALGIMRNRYKRLEADMFRSRMELIDTFTKMDKAREEEERAREGDQKRTTNLEAALRAADEVLRQLTGEMKRRSKCAGDREVALRAGVTDLENRLAHSRRKREHEKLSTWATVAREGERAAGRERYRLMGFLQRYVVESEFLRASRSEAEEAVSLMREKIVLLEDKLARASAAASAAMSAPVAESDPRRAWAAGLATGQRWWPGCPPLTGGRGVLAASADRGPSEGRGADQAGGVSGPLASPSASEHHHTSGSKETQAEMAIRRLEQRIAGSHAHSYCDSGSAGPRGGRSHGGGHGELSLAKGRAAELASLLAATEDERDSLAALLLVAEKKMEQMAITQEEFALTLAWDKAAAWWQPNGCKSQPSRLGHTTGSDATSVQEQSSPAETDSGAARSPAGAGLIAGMTASVESTSCVAAVESMELKRRVRDLEELNDMADAEAMAMERENRRLRMSWQAPLPWTGPCVPASDPYHRRHGRRRRSSEVSSLYVSKCPRKDSASGVDSHEDGIGDDRVDVAIDLSCAGVSHDADKQDEDGQLNSSLLMPRAVSSETVSRGSRTQSAGDPAAPMPPDWDVCARPKGRRRPRPRSSPVGSVVFRHPYPRPPTPPWDRHDGHGHHSFLTEGLAWVLGLPPATTTDNEVLAEVMHLVVERGEARTDAAALEAQLAEMDAQSLSVAKLAATTASAGQSQDVRPRSRTRCHEDATEDSVASSLPPRGGACGVPSAAGSPVIAGVNGCATGPPGRRAVKRKSGDTADRRRSSLIRDSNGAKERVGSGAGTGIADGSTPSRRKDVDLAQQSDLSGTRCPGRGAVGNAVRPRPDGSGSRLGRSVDDTSAVQGEKSPRVFDRMNPDAVTPARVTTRAPAAGNANVRSQAKPAETRSKDDSDGDISRVSFPRILQGRDVSIDITCKKLFTGPMPNQGTRNSDEHEIALLADDDEYEVRVEAYDPAVLKHHTLTIHEEDIRRCFVTHPDLYTLGPHRRRVHEKLANRLTFVSENDVKASLKHQRHGGSGGHAASANGGGNGGASAIGRNDSPSTASGASGPEPNQLLVLLGDAGEIVLAEHIPDAENDQEDAPEFGRKKQVHRFAMSAIKQIEKEEEIVEGVVFQYEAAPAHEDSDPEASEVAKMLATMESEHSSQEEDLDDVDSDSDVNTSDEEDSDEDSDDQDDEDDEDDDDENDDN